MLYFCSMKISLSTKRGKILLHISVWSFLFLFPLLIFMYEEHDMDRNYRMLKLNWLQLTQYAILFYLNYIWLVRHYFFKRKFVVFFAVNLGLILVMLWFNDLIHTTIFADKAFEFGRNQGLRPPDAPDKGGPPPFRFFWIKNFFSLIIPTIIAITVSTVENWFETEEKHKEAARVQLESELQNLRYQIQPHFFFNSLNNIYSLIEVSPEKAQDAVHGLSKMMRYLLYDTSRPLVGLDEELQFILSYIQLMKLRQTDKTVVSYSFPKKELQQWKIAPLLFIPLIENAFKHGISATQPSEIHFDLTLTGDRLLFVGKNTNFPKVDADKSGSGIGLVNLQKRLSLLYPEKHKLKLHVIDQTFEATLQLDLMQQEAINSQKT